LTLQQFRYSKVIDLGVDGKPVTSYLSLIVTFAVSATFFEILMLKPKKWLNFATPPLFEAPAQGEPLKMPG